MAKGTEVIVSADPKGRFDEGIITDTSKPGQFVELVPATNPVSGRFSYRAVSRTAGSKGPVCVLLPDKLQGFPATTAYVANTRCFLYWPIAGEELNVLMQAMSGTGTVNEENIGDKLEINEYGKIQAAGTVPSSSLSAPFELLEHLGNALSGDTLVFARFLGGYA